MWEGIEITHAFHATTDAQAVRDRVYSVFAGHQFRVDATVFEKSKTLPRLQQEDAFYQLAWYLHMKHVAPRVAKTDDDLMVVGASIGTKKKQAALAQAVARVVHQVARTSVARTTYWPAASEPCLQMADYCCWAIQRKWERNDPRSHALIADRIHSEFNVFRDGITRYY